MFDEEELKGGLLFVARATRRLLVRVCITRAHRIVISCRRGSGEKGRFHYLQIWTECVTREKFMMMEGDLPRMTFAM